MSDVQEQCPKCSTLHTRGEYVERTEGDKVLFAAADVTCSCGLALRWSVPFFRHTPSGYVLRVRRDDEVARV